MAPAKRPWFRFYVETFSDEEIRKLSPAERWAWAAVLGLARKSPVAGALLDKAGEPIPDDVIADFAKVKTAEVRSMIDRMGKLDSLSRDADGVLIVAKWDARQFESDDVSARTAKHRAGRNVPTNVPGNDDATPEGTTDGTVPGTESPSVVLPEVQSSTDRDSSFSSEPLVAGEVPEEEEDPRLSECWEILAKIDAEEFTAKGNHIKTRAWFVTAAENRRAINLERALVMIEEHPAITSAELAEAIQAPPAAKGVLLTAIERAERRRKGEFDCTTCEDRGVVENDKGEFVDCECKWKRTA